MINRIKKNRATRSLDMSIRLNPSATATVEERERARDLRDDKQKYIRNALGAVVTKLRGDYRDSCVQMSHLIKFVFNVYPCYKTAELPMDTFDTEVIPWAHSEDASESVAARLDEYLKSEEEASKHAAEHASLVKGISRTCYPNEEEKRKADTYSHK